MQDSHVALTATRSQPVFLLRMLTSSLAPHSLSRLCSLFISCQLQLYPLISMSRAGEISLPSNATLERMARELKNLVNISSTRVLRRDQSK